MFEGIVNFFKKLIKAEKTENSSKDTAKERLHLVLMQDRANVSADFLELMKQEIIEVIKKYIEVDEKSIDVRLTNKVNEDGTNGAPALYANIPIVNIKNEDRKQEQTAKEQPKEEEQKPQEEIKEQPQEIKDAQEVEQENNQQEEKIENAENIEQEEIVENIEQKEEIDNIEITEQQEEANNVENQDEKQEKEETE